MAMMNLEKYSKYRLMHCGDVRALPIQGVEKYGSDGCFVRKEND
jgi:hypothetical protein